MSLRLFALLLVVPAVGRPSDEPRLAVTGDVARQTSLTNAELRTRFASEIKDVAFTLKGEAGHAHAILLLSIVKAAMPKVNPKRKHGDLALAVEVEGADGYAATFGAGDLDDGLGHPVWAALDWNDGPLKPEDGPVRLIVPGDTKPARWVHAVRTLRVVDLAPRKVKPAPADHAMSSREEPSRPGNPYQFTCFISALR